MYVMAIDIYVIFAYTMTSRGVNMKRRDVIGILERHGWRFKRSVGGHDMYSKPGELRPVPVKRHREIPDHEAADIFKEAGIKWPR